MYLLGTGVVAKPSQDADEVRDDGGFVDRAVASPPNRDLLALRSRGADQASRPLEVGRGPPAVGPRTAARVRAVPPVAEKAGWKHLAGRGCNRRVPNSDERRAVDREVESLPYPQVVERRSRRVQTEEVGRRRGSSAAGPGSVSLPPAGACGREAVAMASIRRGAQDVRRADGRRCSAKCGGSSSWCYLLSRCPQHQNCLQNRLQLQIFFSALATKSPASRGFLQADDGTRTHDLLHGKQTL
jgi:hypothetical protein